MSAEEIDTSNPEQLISVAEQLTTMEGNQPSVLGFDPDIPGSVVTWITLFGGRVMDDDGQPALDEPANVEAFQFLTVSTSNWVSARSGAESQTKLMQLARPAPAIRTRAASL